VFRAVEFVLFRFSLLHPIGLVLLFLLPPLAPREREGVAHVFAVLGLMLLGVALQGRFFAYHYGAALHLVALLSGWGLWKLTRFGRRFALGPALLAALVLFYANANGLSEPISGGFFARARQVDAGVARNLPLRRAAAFVSTHTAADQPIFVWGFEPLLYELADRRPASRYIYNAPQRAPWSRDAARPLLMQELEAHPPAAILVERGDRHPGTAGSDGDSTAALAQFPQLREFLAAGYDEGATLERFTVHLRRGAAAPLSRD
jgi:hypothetical protein